MEGHRKTWGILLLMLLTVPGLHRANAEETPVPDPILLQHGIEFTPAPDWYRYEVNARAVFFKSKDNQVTLSLSFPQQKQAGAVAIAQTLLRISKHPINEGSLQLFGVPCHTFVFEEHRGNQTVQLHDHQCLKDGMFYSVLFGAAPAEVPRAQAMFDEAISRIHIH